MSSILIEMGIQKLNFKRCGQVFALSALGCLLFSLSYAAKPVVPARKIMPSARPQARAAPAHSYAPRNPASTREISEAIDITGQSRNLSMGLMFQRDKDTVTFGSPRTNYKDKINSGQTNY